MIVNRMISSKSVIAKVIADLDLKEDQIRISIFNTGKNIPEEDLEFIFDKFYQSKNQNIRKPMGSGLGLAICKKIIAAHQGKIAAKNKETGVVFEINLPS